MTEIRRLHPSEFDLLKQVGDGFCPDPEHSIALVGENSQKIVARIFLIPLSHIEGTFIEAPWRGGVLLKRLFETLELEARAEGLTKLMAYIAPENETYIERLGYKKMPITVWSKELQRCQ